jgi:2-dehydro-3-deoxygluconokinase
MAQVVCFGELLIRLTAPDRQTLIQADRFDLHVGGAEANVAVGLARLGHSAAMISRVPDNELGEAVVGHLRRYGVDASGVSCGPGRMGLYFVERGAGVRPSSILYDREGSSFALASLDEFDWDSLLEGADILHLSGVTPALGQRSAEIALDAAEAARAKGLKVSFDGNYRAQLWSGWDSDPKAVLAELVGQADIFFGNHRDIALLLGRDFSGEGAGRRREAAMAAFHGFPNLELIASTARHIDGEGHRIAARIDTRETEHQTEEIALTDVVDRIGSGDAFAAGVLHAILGGQDMDAAARTGLALAALKHSLPGDACLFGQGDIDSLLAGERDVRR